MKPRFLAEGSRVIGVIDGRMSYGLESLESCSDRSMCKNSICNGMRDCRSEGIHDAIDEMVS